MQRKKTTRNFFMALSLLSLGFAVNAQQLQRVSALKQRLKSNTKVNVGGRAVNQFSVELTPGVTKNIQFNVNDTEGLKETFVGKIVGESNSTAYLQFDGDNQLTGTVISKMEGYGYEMTSTETGEIVTTRKDVDKLLCVNFDDYEDTSKAINRSSVPDINVPIDELQSLPGATVVALLDFDGEVVSGTRWNGGQTINAAPAQLTEDQQREVWLLVSEDFRPFNINITTDESVFNSYAQTRRMRCIFTPTNTAAPGAGGVAYVGSFSWNDDTPCWVFNNGVKGAGEAGSHEIGHTVGLLHDGRTSPSEAYFTGHGNWAPIMGIGYRRDIVQWSKGEYNNANQTQDDISIITTRNGFGFRDDDHGNSTNSASDLVISNDIVSSEGIIERETDTDFFMFSTGGGNINLAMTAYGDEHANLDIEAELLNSSGQVITTSNPSGLSASFNTNLAAGTYYIKIDGAGAGNPGTDGYTDYASIGLYTITGSIANSGGSNQAPTVSITSPLDGTVYTEGDQVTIQANASDSDGSITLVEFFSNGNKIGEDATSPYSLAVNNFATGNYLLTVQATDNGGLSVISGAIEIVVEDIPINNAPTVSITSPNDGQIYEEGDRVTIQASAADSDGVVAIVEFYSNGNKIGEDASSPYSLVLDDVDAGTYSFVAVATDNEGLSTTSGAVSIVVNTPDNQAPVVAITSPSNGQVYAEGSSITLSAEASDADGSVSLVEFYTNGNKVGEDNSSPYSFTLTNMQPGSYALSAVATDNGNLSSTSATVNVTVTEDDVPTCEGCINFNDYSVSTHSSSDEGTYTIEDGGFTFYLQNNAWKSIDFNYTVTENTMIEFEFSSTDEGEIHGFGFDTDNNASSDLLFKLFGTQNWGINDFATYNGNGVTTYQIPVGSFYTGQFNRLVFNCDDDLGGQGNSKFSKVKVYETANPIDVINFNDYVLSSYSQVDTGTPEISNNGTTLTVKDNSWKSINFPYTVTSNTIIEFEFSSGTEGEIHGLGFDIDNGASSDRIFKVHGTQNWGITQYDNYTAGTITYQIPVGQFYTGVFNRLVFVCDKDSSPASSESTFSNVRVYEGNTSNSRSGNLDFTVAEAGNKLIDDELGFSGVTGYGIYPNPVLDVINIQGTEKVESFKIFDLTGTQMIEGKGDKVNTSVLRAGTYTIQINGGQVIRFMKH